MSPVHGIDLEVLHSLELSETNSIPNACLIEDLPNNRWSLELNNDPSVQATADFNMKYDVVLASDNTQIVRSFSIIIEIVNPCETTELQAVEGEFQMTHLIGWVDGATYTDSEGNEISYEAQTLLIADMFKDSVSLEQTDEVGNLIYPLCESTTIYK